VHRKIIIDQNRGRMQIRNCVLVIYKEQFELITYWQAEIACMVENLFGIY